jgi:hypothetical protein
MKIGDKIAFYVFGEEMKGIVYQKNPDKTVSIEVGSIKYPNVRTFKVLPKKGKDVPPWYILKK